MKALINIAIGIAFAWLAALGLAVTLVITSMFFEIVTGHDLIRKDIRPFFQRIMND
jgi:multidrug transporter EmrE-like cation transporter